MNQLDYNYKEFQEIYITDKKLIEDFINTHMKIWQEDILKFDNFRDLLVVDNIKEICFYSYIGIDEELEYTFTFNDLSNRKFHLEKELLQRWLTNHNLIINI